TRCGHLIFALGTALGALFGIAPPCAASLLAQDSVPPERSTADSSAARHDWHLDLAVHHVGVGIGNSPDITGLRLNFRDDGPIRVQGVNVTLWTPYEPAQGVVRGVAIGLPLTGTRNMISTDSRSRRLVLAQAIAFAASRSRASAPVPEIMCRASRSPDSALDPAA